MDSAMIGKIQKARYYADQPERIRFQQFRVTFDGTNAQHAVAYDQGTWRCTCNFFATRRVCSHTMALERLLGVMLPPLEPAPTEATEVPA